MIWFGTEANRFKRFMKASLLHALIPVLILVGCSSDPAKKDEKTAKELAKQQEDQIESPVGRIARKEVNYEQAALYNIQLGLAYLESGQIGRAKTKLNHAIKMAPDSPEVHCAYGQYYERIGEIASAEESFTKAISLKRNYGVTHNSYGAFLCRQGKYEKAEKEFMKAIEDKEYTQTAQVLENAGLCAMAKPDLKAAKKYFERAVRQDPHRTNALIELSYIFFQEEAYQEALGLYHRYLDVAQHTSRSLWVGVQLARHFNDKDKEASYLLLLKSKYPQSAEYKQIQSNA